MTWQEIKFGIDHGIVTPYVAVENAVKTLVRETGEPDGDLCELASMKKGEYVHDCLEALVSMGSCMDTNYMKKRWLVISLLWILANQDKFKDATVKIDQVYADFDYPECMKNFVSYMPSEEPSLNSVEANVERMFSSLELFLQDMSKFYGLETLGRLVVMSR